MKAAHEVLEAELRRLEALDAPTCSICERPITDPDDVTPPTFPQYCQPGDVAHADCEADAVYAMGLRD